VVGEIQVDTEHEYKDKVRNVIRRLVAGLSAVVMLFLASGAISEDDMVILHKGIQSHKAMILDINQELDRLERSTTGGRRQGAIDDLNDALDTITAELIDLEQRYIESLRGQQAATTAPAAKD